MTGVSLDYGDPPPESAALVVSDLSKTFRLPTDRTSTLKERALHPIRSRHSTEFDALKGVSFGVHKGECFGIVGRNGSGKSTLLKCIAGIYHQNSGSVVFDGRMSTFIELGVGFNPELAAYDNVVLNATLLGLTRKQAAARYQKIMDFAELWEFEAVKLKNYSSGMHVRLAFAVMAEIEADVLVIDEVLAVGDAAFQQKCYDALHELRKQGKTILLVTHDMDAVRRFCGRAVLLERGRIVARGEASEVARSYLELNLETSARERDAMRLKDQAQRGPSGAELIGIDILDRNGERHDVVKHGEDFELVVKMRFEQAVEDPWFVLNVLAEDGLPIFATESITKQPNTGNFGPGRDARFSVKIPCLFVSGRYRVAISCGPQDSYKELLNEMNAAVFAVVGGSNSGALVELPTEIAVTVTTDAQTSSTKSTES